MKTNKLLQNMWHVDIIREKELKIANTKVREQLHHIQTKFRENQ